MGEITEIYICKKGQKLKEGRLEVSHHITDKTAAEDDARQRCRKDITIHRIAYYRMSDNGDFRIFYSYTNPRLAAAKRKPPPAEPTIRKRKKKKKPATLMGKIKKLFK